jgi:hypothetical protein
MAPGTLSAAGPLLSKSPGPRLCFCIMGTDRWQGSRSQGGRPLRVEEVRRLGRYASHQTPANFLHEYDLGRFWVTDLSEAVPVRRLHSDPTLVPPGPWHHGPMCDCGGCGEVGL